MWPFEPVAAKEEAQVENLPGVRGMGCLMDGGPDTNISGIALDSNSSIIESIRDRLDALQPINYVAIKDKRTSSRSHLPYLDSWV
jgi:hypothetical protein